MYERLKSDLINRLTDLRSSGLYKKERVFETPQRERIRLQGSASVLNFSSNNYLGLADHPEIVKAAQKALDQWGYGLSSARFICGTQTIHKELEKRVSEFLGTEDTILYSSCFDANGGLFETLLDTNDAIISDELNHASIIDGIRLSKAQRYRYKNNDMRDLEAKLQEAKRMRHRLIATDGVFSMDGFIANLSEICDLADRYNALVMVDDSHAVGFVGPTGRGTHEYCGVLGRVDIITGTFGKALGGASGGYTTGRKEIIEYLRQRSRPYLFSNSIAPSVAATSLTALEMLTRNVDLRELLLKNTRYYRIHMTDLGFNVPAGEHPIVPVIFGDATVATRMADLLLEKGVYVTALSFPVVPENKARIRVQISAAHNQKDLEFCVAKFAEAKAVVCSS